jgi:hypothetical protein
MARLFIAALVFVSLGADAPVMLHPGESIGNATRVVVELKAEGLFKPGDESKEATKPGAAAKPLALKVEARVEFVEKVLAVAKDGAPTRAVRRVEKAGSAINGEVRAMAAALRAEVALLVAELREGQIVAVSPGGPLTSSELELAQSPGDPLALAALLPAAAVAKGETWNVGSDAARSLSGYDTLEDNALKATLESIDEARALGRLKGTIRGSVLGSPGTIEIAGTFTFDRKAGRVEALEVERNEVRKAGPVEDGLDIKSTLKVTRKGIDTPSDLADTALAGVPLEINPARELLLFRSPDGKYTLIHDRDWHIYWDSERQTVLRRLAKGQVVANCNLTIGPNAGKGRHQDPVQFREDIKRAAGKRFVAVLSEGELEGSPAGGYRYRVAVQGKEGDADVLWYYILIAGPQGDQVLAVFSLPLSAQDRFGDQDLRLAGSFEWIGAAAKP